MGHMLASDTMVSEAIEVTGIGLQAATFQGMPDLETNFTLFEPVKVNESEEGRGGARVLLAKVRPNEDISIAIEDICSRQGIEKANVHGIGSLNQVRFTDGGRVDSYATEVLIHEGRVESVDGRPRASLQIDVVDMEGQIFSGELVHGDNPVCVTFELVIEEVI
jgi:predicted DNA-binding protein with PD1-like motif